MQEQACRRHRGEAGSLEERDRKLAERERGVREEEAAAARQGHQFIPDLEGDSPPTGKKGRSPSEKRARGEEEEGGHARGKRRQVEEQRAGGAMGAPWLTSASPEPAATKCCSALPLPRHSARRPVRREPGTVQAW